MNLWRNFYEEKGYDKISHNRIRRYEILLEYLGEKQQVNLEYYKELLILDLYVRENLKSRPEWAKNLMPYKRRIQEFYRKEEENPVLLGEYREYQAKQTMKMTHLEVFAYDVLHLKERAGEYPVLFDYKKRNPLSHDAAVYQLTLL